VAAPEKPPLLYLLAAFGLVLGSFGGMFALSKALPLTASRDQYVSAYREWFDKLPAAKLENTQLPEKEADVIYSRRGVALPLAVMNIILSTLLFLGCGRALRGSLWGYSAWKFAALASVPYTVLASAFGLVQAREMGAAMPNDVIVEMAMRLSVLKTIILDGLAVLYYVACLLYLRRPSIRALFLRPPAA
jgi:hypothetical protein